jgi:hypothetical protein
MFTVLCLLAVLGLVAVGVLATLGYHKAFGPFFGLFFSYQLWEVIFKAVGKLFEAIADANR